MNYISTRGNYPACNGATAINLGMVPDGGLFVPESLPFLPFEKYIRDNEDCYQTTAVSVLEPLLPDFAGNALKKSVDEAYNRSTFDMSSVVPITDLDDRRSVLELWHGPTAAFKDIALQLLPRLTLLSKKKTGNTRHTVILVATSGDTGKAALEGFKNVEGTSIIVFYPHDGVSEIQKLQMATTAGRNTAVLGVRGNFDDCQTEVKRLFSDTSLRRELLSTGVELSSANSINWGRLCPQIVYYFTAYGDLVRRRKIDAGDKVNIVVPTGNFGNILAGYYAFQMGLPVEKLVCASNKNRVLADFFQEGIYNRNRQFHRTTSPSMDILISSNLERFLFEMCGRDGKRIVGWYDELSRKGSFSIDASTMDAIRAIVIAGWVDEDRVYSTIKKVYRESGYLVDTHTAVGIALSDSLDTRKNYTLLASTASPYKFGKYVVGALGGDITGDEFACIEQLSKMSRVPVHRAIQMLPEIPVLHDKVIDTGDMRSSLLELISNLLKKNKE